MSLRQICSLNLRGSTVHINYHKIQNSKSFKILRKPPEDDDISDIHYNPKISKILYYSTDKFILQISRHLLRSSTPMLLETQQKRPTNSQNNGDAQTTREMEAHSLQGLINSCSTDDMIQSKEILP